MEALRISLAHSPLLRSQRLQSHLPNGPQKLSTSRSIKPFVSNTLFRPTSEVSAEPSTSSASFETRTTPSPPPNRVSANSLQYPHGFLGVVPDCTATNENDNGNIVDAMEYLTNILSSKVYDVAIESPLELATKLSEQLGVRVWMKREDLQPVFFKLRGAYNMMAKLPREQLDRGVICFSAGNHAQGVALATKKLNCSALIAMPVTTQEIKVSV